MKRETLITKTNRIYFLVLSLLSVLAFPLTASAKELISETHIAYYGEDFYDVISQKAAPTGSALTKELNYILNSFHVKKEKEYDEIVSFCDQKTEQNCYHHNALSYTQARMALFQNLHLQKDDAGHAYVKEVYCEKVLTSSDFPKGKGISAQEMPDAKIVNVEHTWPQSLFNKTGYSLTMQKTDLHHLFPTLSNINGQRGNWHFDEVKYPVEAKKSICNASTFGQTEKDRTAEYFFTPPVSHRGNVARALFYFSVKYELPISASEEQAMRKWHKEDPVDAAEKERNDKIFAIQGTRNPFIDFPELSDRIFDF